MYKYIVRLLEIAITTYGKKYKDLANNYKNILNRVLTNSTDSEDLEYIQDLYIKGFKQETFTTEDKRAINEELQELKINILKRNS